VRILRLTWAGAAHTLPRVRPLLLAIWLCASGCALGLVLCASGCALGLVLCASGCALAGHDRDLGPPPSAADGAGRCALPVADDQDQDGLCDATEKDVGSNPGALDSDGDGYPDVVEVLNAFDPSDPESPGQEQVGFLVAERDASYQFETRATVDGEGEAYTGSFDAYATLNARS